MKIKNYTDYKVGLKTRGSRRIDSYNFEEYEHERVIEKITGYELLKLLTQYVNQDSFMSIEVKGNKVFLELFNLSTCEDSSLEFEITELRGKGNGSNE